MCDRGRVGERKALWVKWIWIFKASDIAYPTPLAAHTHTHTYTNHLQFYELIWTNFRVSAFQKGYNNIINSFCLQWVLRHGICVIEFWIYTCWFDIFLLRERKKNFGACIFRAELPNFRFRIIFGANVSTKSRSIENVQKEKNIHLPARPMNQIGRRPKSAANWKTPFLVYSWKWTAKLGPMVCRFVCSWVMILVAL